MSKYEEYAKKLESLKGTDKELIAEVLLDIRYVLNSIDKQMKGKTGLKEAKKDK